MFLAVSVESLFDYEIPKLQSKTKYNTFIILFIFVFIIVFIIFIIFFENMAMKNWKLKKVADNYELYIII